MKRRFASGSSRMEDAMDRASEWAVNTALVEQSIASHTRAPQEVVLDFDATADRVHGDQEGRFVQGNYDHHCFLTLHVFGGKQLPESHLHPANIEPAKHAGAILPLLMRRPREVWPKTRIIFRADSGFCRHWLLG